MNNDFLNISPLKQKISYSQYWIETIWINKENRNNLDKYVKINNKDKIIKLMNHRSGFIIALPHQGNWEFAIPAGVNLGLKLVAVAEPLKNQRILDWFISLRESIGCKIVIGGKKNQKYDSLVDFIDRGYAVCLVAERHLLRSGAPELFFGKAAAFPTGPINLAIDTGCPIIPTTCLSTNEGFTIHFGQPFYVPEFGDKAQSIQHGVKTLVKEFENLIKIDPNQWHSIMPIWSDE